MDKNKGKERLEKLIIILMVMSLWIFAAVDTAATPLPTKPNEKSSVGQENSAAARTENDYPGIIRFHVIANSDTSEDQKLKYGVRDYVLPRLESEITDAADASDGLTDTANITREYISKNLARIQGMAVEYVRSCGFDYDVKAELGVCAIPAKKYDDLYFPAGNYEALTIRIGEGAGQNWWCVVFPPLCLIDGNSSEYGSGDDVTAERIVLKSKIKEMLKIA